MKRVAVVTSIPTPYRDPFWRFVQKLKQIELDVYYLAGGKPDRPWAVDWIQPKGSQVVPGINLDFWQGGGASIYFNWSLISRLRKGRYDALVIGGYNHPSLLWAISFAMRRGLPWYLMCETFRIGRRGRSAGWLRNSLVKRVIQAADGAFPTGRKAAGFIRHYGGIDKQVTLLPNVPDIELIAAKCEKLRGDRQLLRKKLGIFSERMILFVGRLIDKKNVSNLLEAFSRLPCRDDVMLGIVGDGELRLSLKEQAASLGINDRVIFAGFQQPDALLEWYVSADMLVQPSSETWGVVPIEGLASGLPIIVSEKVGCADDLYELVPWAVSVVKHGSMSALVEAMTAALSANELSPLGDRLQRWSYPHLAMEFCRTIVK